MSAINNYSAQINARLAAIESRIQANDLAGARQLIAAPVCYTGSLAAASTEAIYVPQQNELMHMITELAKNNLSPARTPPRIHLLTKQDEELPDSFPSGKLPTKVVSVIASYEDFTLKLDEPLHISSARAMALFSFFCGSFSPKDLTLALNTQINNLHDFPDVQAMAFISAALQSVPSPTFIFDLADRMLNAIRKNQKALIASDRPLSFPSAGNVGGVLNTVVNEFKLNKKIYNFSMNFKFGMYSDKQGELMLCITENMESILKLASTHYTDKKIKLVTCTQIQHIYFDLNPLSQSSFKWELEVYESQLQILPKSLCYQFVSCNVKIPQLILNNNLVRAIREYPFDAAYAHSLVAAGADINSFKNDLPDQWWDERLPFFLSYPLSLDLFETIIKGLSRPISQETINQILSYGRVHKEFFIQLMHTFFDWAHIPFFDDCPNEEIFISALIGLWLELDPKALKELPVIHFKFLFLLEHSHPILNMLEKVHNVRLESISDEMLRALIQWFNYFKVNALEKGFKPGDEYPFIKLRINQLLDILRERNIAFIQEDLYKRIALLLTDTNEQLRKEISSLAKK